MRRVRKYPQDDKEFAYLPDVAAALGVTEHNSFRTVRDYAKRYRTETEGEIQVVTNGNYFTCVTWEQLRPFAQWFQQYQAQKWGKPPQKDARPIPIAIPQFSGFMKQRILDASLAFGEKMVEAGVPEAAFLFFEQPTGRNFSTGRVRFEFEEIDDE